MTNQAVSVLNDLIATTIDSIDGYEKAADDANADRFAALFRERAAERRDVVAQLKTEVSRLGAEPEDDGTILAGIHRAFLGLKDAVTGQDDAAIADEVERGEGHIKSKFETALEGDDLTGTARATVETCYGSIMKGHEQMLALKHSLNS